MTNEVKELKDKVKVLSKMINTQLNTIEEQQKVIMKYQTKFRIIHDTSEL